MTARRLLTVAVCILSAACAPSLAAACSICLSGDPTIHNLGVQAAHRGQWRFTVENRSHSKTNALEDLEYPQNSEFEHENRVMAMTSYAPTERLLLGVNVPFLDRRHINYAPGADVKTSAASVGDAELHLRYDILTSRATSMSRSTSIVGGVAIPTGSNNLTESGTDVRIEEHVQPGSGTWAAIAGVAQLVHGPTRWLYVSAIGRVGGENHFAYHYGNSLLMTAEVGQQVRPWLSAIVGVAGRATQRDKQGQTDEGVPLPPNSFNPESGGQIAFVTPGVQVRVTPYLSLRGEAYLPVWNNLYGTQEEDPNLLFSVTYAR